MDEKSAAEKAQEYAKFLASDLKKDSATLKRKTQEKKKSNLELFKEELRQIQEEREERHKFKHIAQSNISQNKDLQEHTLDHDVIERSGSHDTGDPNTTNLYLGNLCPKVAIAP